MATYALTADGQETPVFTSGGATFAVYVGGTPGQAIIEVLRLNTASGVYDVVGHIIAGKTPQFVSETNAGSYKLKARTSGAVTDLKIEVAI